MIDAYSRVDTGVGLVVLEIEQGSGFKQELTLTIEAAEALAMAIHDAWNAAAVAEDDARTSIAESIHDLECVPALRTILAATNPSGPPARIEGVQKTPQLGYLQSLGLVLWTGVHWKVLISHEMASELLERTGRYA